MRFDRDCKGLLECLAAREVRYLVVGGYAVAVHVHPRYTGDLDPWVSTSAEHAESVPAALHDFGLGSLGHAADDVTRPGNVVQRGDPPVRVDLLTSIDSACASMVRCTRRTPRQTRSSCAPLACRAMPSQPVDPVVAGRDPGDGPDLRPGQPSGGEGLLQGRQVAQRLGHPHPLPGRRQAGAGAPGEPVGARQHPRSAPRLPPVELPDQGEQVGLTGSDPAGPGADPVGELLFRQCGDVVHGWTVGTPTDTPGAHADRLWTRASPGSRGAASGPMPPGTNAPGRSRCG